MSRRALPRGAVAIAVAAVVALAVVAVNCDDDDSAAVPGRDGGADVRDASGGPITANRPELREFSDALAAQLRVPAGFRVGVFARGLGNPRWLAAGPNGAVYVTINATSEVIRLADANGDGDADDAGERRAVASKATMPDLDGVHGIAIHDDRMYLGAVKAVVVATIAADGGLTGLTKLIGELPDGGQHPRRTLAVGPDGKLYVTVGSDCNACPESNSQHATVLRFELSGEPAPNPPNPAHLMLAANPTTMVSPRVFASGLRNTLGFDWHPAAGTLWGADNGSDGLGDDLPPDELNRIEAGKAYGWPYCFADRRVDPVVDQPSRTLTKEAYCPTTEPSIAGLPAHSAPIGFVFYRGGQFPAEYVGDALVTLRGSWNRSVPTGYQVVRVRFGGGAPGAVEEFLSGFLMEGGAAHFGRPAGLAIDAAGALLIAEDTNGVVYRVSHDGAPGGDR